MKKNQQEKRDEGIQK